MKGIQPKNGKIGEYHLVNGLILVVVLTMIAVIRWEAVPVHCVYTERGSGCQTCGVTRAFAAAINGSFDQMNTPFLLLFILLIGQVVFRPTFSLLLKITQRFNLLRGIDILLSASLLVAFVYFLYF